MKARAGGTVTKGKKSCIKRMWIQVDGKLESEFLLVLNCQGGF